MSRRSDDFAAARLAAKIAYHQRKAAERLVAVEEVRNEDIDALSSGIGVQLTEARLDLLEQREEKLDLGKKLKKMADQREGLEDIVEGVDLPPTDFHQTLPIEEHARY